MKYSTAADSQRSTASFLCHRVVNTLNIFP